MWMNPSKVYLHYKMLKRYTFLKSVIIIICLPKKYRDKKDSYAYELHNESLFCKVIESHFEWKKINKWNKNSIHKITVCEHLNRFLKFYISFQTWDTWELTCNDFSLLKDATNREFWCSIFMIIIIYIIIEMT